MSKIPTRLTIKFLLPNVTSRHQPADMGMIAALKVGYKAMFLRSLLEIFDNEGGFEAAAASRARQKRGCRGLQHGGKPHILDCMVMLKHVWGGRSDRYITSEGIKRCWRKADILPQAWNLDINNDVGRASIPERQKVLSKKASDELCDLMSGIKLRANSSYIDVSSSTTNVFKDSFVTDGDLSRDDIENMAEVWVDIEDDQDIVNTIIDDKLQEIEEVDASKTDDDDYNDEEQDEIIVVSEKECRIKNKHTFQESIGAFDMIQLFMDEEKLPLDRKLALERIVQCSGASNAKAEGITEDDEELFQTNT